MARFSRISEIKRRRLKCMSTSHLNTETRAVLRGQLDTVTAKGEFGTSPSVLYVNLVSIVCRLWPHPRHANSPFSFHNRAYTHTALGVAARFEYVCNSAGAITLNVTASNDKTIFLQDTCFKRKLFLFMKNTIAFLWSAPFTC